MLTPAIDSAVATRPSVGLTAAEAARALAEFGPNELPEPRSSIWRVARRQLDSVLVWILVGALGVSVAIGLSEPGGVGRFVDAIVIGAILVLNFTFGFAQEYAAEQAIAALRRLTALQALVRRDGEPTRVAAREVVPGDVVLIAAGERVPADGRILSCAHLRADESALTGEALEVGKAADAVDPSADLAEQSDRLFAGTLVTRGTAELLVEQTGLRTEVGEIASAVGATETPPTPLQLRLASLGRLIGGVVLVLAALVVVVGVVQGSPLLDVLLVGVSLAVSAVPEGLPAVVTVCFALGVRQMARRQALVRRLDSLETLGAVTVICSDKTGTITENRMTVVQTWVATPGDETLLHRIGSSCNRATLPEEGAPTELALLGAAAAAGVERLPIDDEEIPFTSKSRSMQTRHGSRSFLKGAASVVAARCSADAGARLNEQATVLASQGLRVLAGAVVEGDSVRAVGLWGMSDPPREGVADAVSAARDAGVRTVMITGDSPSTARAIARQVGIEADAVLTGAEVSALPESERADRIAQTSVFARVEPLHKLEILRVLIDRGEVVAMTGDGVNDAPALRGAHVGIAMGKRGTDVARGAASIILADDHYASIVAAIAEGRRIHDNIRRFVLYLLRANFDELLLILTAFLLKLPLPLLPVHILWINLLTDGPPALAMAAEPAEPGLMQRPPRSPRAHLLAGEGGRLVGTAVIAFLALLGYFLYALKGDASIEHARTGTLTLAVVIEVLLAFSSRSPLRIWRSRPWANRWLIGACALVLASHLVLLYSPLREVFHLVALSAPDWGLIVAIGLVAIMVVEGFKPRARPPVD